MPSGLQLFASTWSQVGTDLPSRPMEVFRSWKMGPEEEQPGPASVVASAMWPMSCTHYAGMLECGALPKIPPNVGGHIGTRQRGVVAVGKELQRRMTIAHIVGRCCGGSNLPGTHGSGGAR